MKFHTKLELCLVLAFLKINCAFCQINFPEDETTTALPNLLSQRIGSTPPVKNSEPILKFEALLDVHEHLQEAQFLLETSKNVFSNAREVTPLDNGRWKVTVGCDMHFSLFPYDIHSCALSLSEEVQSVFCAELKSYEFQAKGWLTLPSLKLPGNVTTNQKIYLLLERTSTMQIFSQMYSPVMMLVWLSFLTMFSVTSHMIRVGSSLAMLLCIILVTTIIWPDIPRAGQGGTTFLEHYFAICVGFVFQVFFNNILMYWYSALALKHIKKSQMNNGDVEQQNNGGVSLSTNGIIVPALKEETKKKAKDEKPESEEEKFIKTLGKFHRFTYFKGLKPAKKQLPIAFLIINLIYWPVVLYLSSGLPKGFQAMPDAAKIAENVRYCI